jgi:hypothetical protein
MRAPLPGLDALDIAALKVLILSQHEEKKRQLTALAQLREEPQAELAAHAQQIEHLKLVVEKLRHMLFVLHQHGVSCRREGTDRCRRKVASPVAEQNGQIAGGVQCYPFQTAEIRQRW